MPTFKDHFSERSADYAIHRPGYPMALVEVLADASPATGLALDCGCGTGQLAVLLARRFDRVVALDASPQQIGNATPDPRVEYRCAPAERSGLPDRSTDLIVAAQAAHWFDLPAFYTEVRRIARPHAAVALVSYGILELADDSELDRLVARFYHTVLGRYWPAERRHVESGYRTLPFPFDETEVPALALEVAWTQADFIGYVETWSAVRALEKAAGTAPLQTFRRELARAWGSAPTTHTVRWPLALRIGHVAGGPR